MPKHGTTSSKDKSIRLVKSAAGTLTKVLDMIQEDRYCPEIIQQIDSVLGLLKTSKKELLTGHLDHCLQNKLDENRDKTINELLKIYNLSN